MSEIRWESLQLEIAGVQVHVRRSEQVTPDSPPLVILHRDIGTLDHVSFYDTLAANRQVIIPDHAGFGRSSRPEWARNVRDLTIIHSQTLTSLGIERYSLVGLGFGGWIAAELAAMAPSRVNGIALVGAMGIKPPTDYIFDQAMVDYIQYVRAGFHQADKFIGAFGEEVSLDQLEQWDICREMCFRVAWKPYMYSMSLPHLIGGLNIPSALVWGEHDKIVPRSAGEAYSVALSAPLQIIADVGHHIEFEAPDELARLIKPVL